MLLELMQQMDLPPREALLIGDTSHDLEMARAARVDALAVTYGAHPEASLRAGAPLTLVSTVKDLSAWLAQNA